MAVSQKDKSILQDLARKVAEIAADPVQDQRREHWTRHNRLERTRPLVLLQDSTGHETGGKIQIECEDQWAQGQERGLRSRVYQAEQIGDDAIHEATVVCGIVTGCTGYGIEGDATRPDHVFGAAHYNGVIGDDDSPERIPMPEVTVDWDATARNRAQLEELYDGILEVRTQGLSRIWYAPLDTFLQWRGIEQMMIDMIDRPQWLHGWLNRMCEYQLSQLEQCESLGTLSLNNGAHGVASGGIGCTDQLPQPDFDGEHVRLKDMWGFATTQIFSEVSPAMHEEFALTYEKRVLERFGLASYGCCEPLHHKIDLVFEHVPNLRRISMSPRADVARGAEVLGKRAIFSRKPNPALLGTTEWNEDLIRSDLRDTFEKTRGCVVEVIMKDLHTVHNEPERMGKWVQVARELAEEYA